MEGKVSQEILLTFQTPHLKAILTTAPPQSIWKSVGRMCHYPKVSVQRAGWAGRDLCLQ